MENQFEAKIICIASNLIIKIPEVISNRLPSRGMVMVGGTMNAKQFEAPLEPDGKGGHWFEVTPSLAEKVKVKSGDTVILSILPMKQWNEPDLPRDIIEAINSEGLLKEWNSLTTKAKWDWMRWIRSTKNLDTREKRIRVTCSKLKMGDKRPCCFNRTSCTVTEVSKSGILI